MIIPKRTRNVIKYEQALKKGKPKCVYDASEKKTRPEGHPDPKQSLKEQGGRSDEISPSKLQN